MQPKIYSKIRLSAMFLFVLLVLEPIKAAIIFESAALYGVGGPPPWPTLVIDDVQSVGVRFYIGQPVQVTSIGGHLYAHDRNQGTFYGAILSLSSADDLPLGNKSTPIGDTNQVVASTVFVPNFPSTDYRTPLSAELEPGYYALIFGTNALGALNGKGGMMMHQPTIPGEWSGISWQSDTPPEVWHTTTDMSEVRFVVEGVVVPEPATLFVLGLGAVMLRRKWC